MPTDSAVYDDTSYVDAESGEFIHGATMSRISEKCRCEEKKIVKKRRKSKDADSDTK